MHTTSTLRLLTPLLFTATLPLTMGAQGDGCAANSQSPVPDVEGEWAITYDDQLDVTITIGGATYNETLGAEGGVVTIEHEGQPLSFDLDCDRPEVLCPSESWPESVSITQPNPNFPHRMHVVLPEQRCVGTLVAPDPAECGPGTLNEDCDQVCDGTIEVREAIRFGSIGERGDSFRLFLGGGIASNGINCALLGWSVADAALDTRGEPAAEDYTATSMSAGLVTVAYAGGCLWAGDPNMDGELEALVLGAGVSFSTGFTGERL
ncbi:hypothetical protein [Haliangium sp.]|uniref:hypothetical protein n=1 Tax=Haliangium sp. TaxID=2663208 RepID=UPI003D0C2676